jgi:hypothetical protein
MFELAYSHARWLGEGQDAAQAVVHIATSERLELVDSVEKRSLAVVAKS